MKLEKIVKWIDSTLNVAAFDDVAANGLQIDGPEDVLKVAFAVDASVEMMERAAEVGAQLLVTHHGISWGGGIRRLTGGVYNVVKTAIANNVALAAYHLPLDAHPKLGNNVLFAAHLGLRNLKKAFSYHGNVIGIIGENKYGAKVGVCSGGAGEFAEEAQRLGCELFVTGEANWGEVVAAENAGIRMVCGGHYDTETFGVKALADAMRKALKIKTVFIERKVEKHEEGN